MFDANVAMMTLPSRALMIRSNASATIVSDGVWPGFSTRTQSQRSASTPRRPRPASISRLVGRAVDRGVVELEVGGVNDHSHWRVDHEANAVRDTVVHAEGLDLEHAGVDDLAGRHGANVGALGEPVLAHLRRDEPARQRRGVDREVEVADEVGKGADVVLVAVGDEHALDAVAVIAEVLDVRDDEIDSQHVVRWELEAEVDENDVVFALDDEAILADLANPAERQDANR